MTLKIGEIVKLKKATFGFRLAKPYSAIPIAQDSLVQVFEDISDPLLSEVGIQTFRAAVLKYHPKTQNYLPTKVTLFLRSQPNQEIGLLAEWEKWIPCLSRLGR